MGVGVSWDCAAPRCATFFLKNKAQISFWAFSTFMGRRFTAECKEYLEWSY